jgi:hypothetical protein
MRHIIKLKNETDWATEYGVYAINRDTRIFENTSWTEGLRMVFFTDTDENDVSTDLARTLLWQGLDYEFAIYDGEHHLVGYVYRPEEEEDNEPKEVKKVFRFHAHTWADVVVTGTTDLTEEEWYDLANDKYNEGDYADDPSNFENTDCEEVTDYYEKNGLPM